MGTRICRTCKIEKEYNYFCLNERSESVYRDERLNIWHGKQCYDCKKAEIKRKSNKRELGKKICLYCKKEFMPSFNIHQRYCMTECREASKL